MFNIILSICTSFYWFKHCNVSRSHHSWKPFADFWLTNQSTISLPRMTKMPLLMSFQSHAKKFACTSFHIGGFLFVRYDQKASWDFLAADFWFCLLNSFPLHPLFYIALSSPWLGKRNLVYMLLSDSELVHLYTPTSMLAHLALLYPASQKVAGYYVIPSELWVSVRPSVVRPSVHLSVHPSICQRFVSVLKL